MIQYCRWKNQTSKLWSPTWLSTGADPFLPVHNTSEQHYYNLFQFKSSSIRHTNLVGVSFTNFSTSITKLQGLQSVVHSHWYKTKQGKAILTFSCGYSRALIPRIRYPGVTIDSDLSFTHHISFIVKSCYFNIRNFSKIRKYSLLSSITQINKRLQRIQNTICHITSRIPCRASTTNAMKKLN